VCPPAVEVEGTRLLTLPLAELQQMDAVQLGESSFVLEQFAFFLQTVVNREQASLRRAEENLNRLLGKLLPKQTVSWYEERRLRAIASDEKASRIDAERVKIQLRLDRLAFLVAKIISLAGKLVELQQTKRNRR
jgi:hypothetical protein